MNATACVLLDLDGTVLDTAPDLGAALNALRAERELPPLPLAAVRGKASWGTRGMLGAGLGLKPADADYDSAHARFIALYRERLTDDAQPFPGMRAALARLGHNGITWGVVTNKLEALALPLMAAMRFDPSPACVIGGDSAARAKPHPAPLLLACERAGVDPERCIYVGDSARDIAAGRAAGMRTIGVTYGYFEADEDLIGW
ncbi:MAG: HAD-IA family hydrolase, partial [Salinisphaera sp.]|nr:HAD-IA family hydrolase [Salinisphaera sp.]